MFVLTLILSILLGLAFIGAGVAKIRRQQPVTGTMEFLGVSPGLQRIIGVLEVLGGIAVAAGLALQPLGIAAAVGLVLVMIGALGYHLRRATHLRTPPERWSC